MSSDYLVEEVLALHDFQKAGLDFPQEVCQTAIHAMTAEDLVLSIHQRVYQQMQVVL